MFRYIQRTIDSWFPPSPEEVHHRWRKVQRQQERDSNRLIRDIEEEEEKTREEMKKEARKGNLEGVKFLGKHLISRKHAKNKMIQSKNNMQNIGNTIQQQAFNARFVKSLEEGTDALEALSWTTRSGVESMQEFIREQEHMKQIQEMQEDEWEEIIKDGIEEEIEEEVNKEVDEVMLEVFNSLGPLPPTFTPDILSSVENLPWPPSEKLNRSPSF